MCAQLLQSCPVLSDPMDCSLPSSSVHGILQERILECVAISFSRGSSQFRDWTRVSCIAGRFFTTEPPELTLIKAFSHSHFEPRNHLVKIKDIIWCFFLFACEKIKAQEGKATCQTKLRPRAQFGALSVQPISEPQNMSLSGWFVCFLSWCSKLDDLTPKMSKQCSRVRIWGQLSSVNVLV